MELLEQNLLGPRNLMFLNGAVLSTRVERIIVDGYGHPVMLIDDLDRCYNWSTIVEVRKNLWMSA